MGGVLMLEAVLLIFSVLVAGISYADNVPTREKTGPSLRAEWQRVKDTRQLEISLRDHLNEKQRELINSGFSTFSQLLIYENSARANGSSPLFEITCTVKFDLWEERYELARLDQKNPQAISVQHFDEYATLCLTVAIADTEIRPHLARGLKAELHIDQISAAKATEVKEWLVRQQSGVMRGIFSHMLGDLKLSESVTVQIEIPPGGQG